MVHASLRSFAAPIAGGADTLLNVLLARGRTVVVPAFTEPQFGLAAPATLRPARNGIDYTALPAVPPLPEGATYAADCGLINPGLGVLPAALISRAGAVRGEHPLNSFAALGPLADELIAAQNPADVYGPIRGLAARAGLILLIGVGLNRMTALHLAEQQSEPSVPALPEAPTASCPCSKSDPAPKDSRDWNRPCTRMHAPRWWRLAVAGLSRTANPCRRDYRHHRRPGHHPLCRQRLPAMSRLDRRRAYRNPPPIGIGIGG